MTYSRTLLFLTGTRADFGKIKSILKEILKYPEEFEIKLFVTGMHMDFKYGYTIREIENSGFKEILYPFINFSRNDSMDTTLANTINGLSNFIQGQNIDLIVVHGDRPEALAGAIVGSFNNIKVGHIEGGEISGTIDEMIRHSVSKLSHYHFVSNDIAKNRLIKMGEYPSDIFVIGNPDLDIILKNKLPDIEEVKNHYKIPFEKYFTVLFHPVTTDEKFEKNATEVFEALSCIDENMICIYPNNDKGSNTIISLYRKYLEDKKNVKIYPSIRFEYFLSLLKNSDFLLGNSSAGIHEAPYLGLPSINIGNRQEGRAKQDSIINCEYDKENILQTIKLVQNSNFEFSREFGKGDSAEKFMRIIREENIWKKSSQKKLHGY